MQRPADLISRFHTGAHVLDGGLATELPHRGVSIDGPLWSGRALLENPDAIKQLHLHYLQAGADVLITASYQLTFQGMKAAGFSEADTERALLQSVQLAINARGELQTPNAEHRTLIAASIGPYGAFTADGGEYRGDYGLSVDDLVEFHRRRFELLAESQADLIAFETTPCLDEARAYARMLQSRPDMPAWISFSCRDGEHVSHGERIADCARELEAMPNVVAIGVNCTPPRYITSLVRELRSATARPIVVYPNGGMPDGHDCPTGPSQAEEIAMCAKEWIAKGANLIGGCCYTSPRHIAALRRSLNALQR